MIVYPEISKVAFTLGPVTIHWYGIMYVLGFICTFLILRKRAPQPHWNYDKQAPEDIVFFGMIGVIVGGRLGYMLVYGLDQLIANPASIVAIWDGGMSFHGGLIGVLVAMWWYGRKKGRGFWEVTDFLAPAVAPGLFFGRMGNFINGELWGKPTDVPWAFFYEGTRRPEVAAVFADGLPRHPSMLYEAALEGLALFVILWLYSSRPRPTMAVSGMFLLFYGIFRSAVEFVRIPDAHMGDGGYLAFGWVTTGLVLSVPMILVGLLLIVLAYKRNTPALENKTS